MTAHPVAQRVLRQSGEDAFDVVVLDYDARFLRRKRLCTERGFVFVVDLEQTTSLDDGDGLLLADGRQIRVRAAVEDVLEVRGANLPRLAWHIGNRHTPCQVAGDHLLIQRDPVIRHMLDHLGAHVSEARHPFTPEGGAYGHGRTHSHDHGHSAHVDAPEHNHEHNHEHSHADE